MSDMPYDDTFEPTFEPTVDSYDMSADGVYDTEVTRYSDGTFTVAVDTDGNSVGDLLGIDTDGDGRVDIMVSQLPGDIFVLHQDLDGDGIADQQIEYTREQLATMAPDVLAAVEVQFTAVETIDPVYEPVDPNPNDPVNWIEDGRLVGDPVGDAEHWFVQAQNGFCVPASVAQIVAEYTGLHFEDESFFVERTNELGLFVYGPDGVPGMTYTGALELLESYDIPAELTVGSVESLAESLDDGRRIMLFIDSGEIWYGEDVEDNAADHAITVTGIDFARGVVIISDTGDPNGNMNEISIADFEDAWADSGYAMVQCDQPAPDHGGSVVEFNQWDNPYTMGAGQDAPEGEVVLASGEAAPSQIASMTDWVTEHPWVLLPVVLSAGALIAKI